MAGGSCQAPKQADYARHVLVLSSESGLVIRRQMLELSLEIVMSEGRFSINDDHAFQGKFDVNKYDQIHAIASISSQSLDLLAREPLRKSIATRTVIGLISGYAFLDRQKRRGGRLRGSDTGWPAMTTSQPSRMAQGETITRGPWDRARSSRFRRWVVPLNFRDGRAL
jgi:hypothetical protein